MTERVITADLCDAEHRFFYYSDNRKPCPYCLVERLQTKCDDLEYCNDFAGKNIERLEAEVARLAEQYSQCQQFIGTQKVLTNELCETLDALDATEETPNG